MSLTIAVLAAMSLAQTSQKPYSEALRPQFHFSAKTGWLNDPNGLVFYKGTYHLFFQHNPKGNEWGNMTWGHATSPDLVHWTQHANAIEPDKLGTIFSGSAVVDWNNTAGLQTGTDPTLVALYCCAGGTSPESTGQPFTQCMAYSVDAGKTWQKYAHNPVLGHIVHENRDPKVVWYEPLKEWVMALYLDGAEFALFRSDDLKSWSLMQKITVDGAGECPDFFETPVEGSGEKKWVFTSASGRYVVGSFDGIRFVPEQKPLNMDFGPNYYAVQTYSDIPHRDGRRIQVAWMNGGKYPDMPFNQQMSFPCRLTLHETPAGYRIYRMPVDEIHSLYAHTDRSRNVKVGPSSNPLSSLKGDLYDIEFEIDPTGAHQINLDIRGTDVVLDTVAHKLTIGDRTIAFEPRAGLFKLRALIDRTSIELYGNDGEVSYTGCYLPKPGTGLALSTTGGSAVLRSLTIHTLKSAW